MLRHLSILQITELASLVALFALALVNFARLRRPHRITSKEFRQMLDKTLMSDIDYGIKWYGVPAANVEVHFKNNPMPAFDPLTGQEAVDNIAIARKKMCDK